MPHVELPQAEFKVVMLGDTNVGKTSLVLRFAEGYYRENSRSPTVGAFFITKRVQTERGITCKVQIWDTAGQAQFRKMAPMYYKTAAAAILCYDVSNPASFERIKEWLEELSPTIQAGNIVIAIAATKNDLLEEPANESSFVPSIQAKNLSQSVNGIFIDTSARNDENVNLLFQKVAERVLSVREQARNMGLEANGIYAIPVTPGASINENGDVVKSYPRTTDHRRGVGISNGHHKHHPIKELNGGGGGSPEKAMDSKGAHSRRSSGGGGGIVTEDFTDSESTAMGLCMGPFMECSSSKGDSSCIIC